MKNNLLNKLVEFKEEFLEKLKGLTHFCSPVINSKNYYVKTGGVDGAGFISIQCKYCNRSEKEFWI